MTTQEQEVEEVKETSDSELDETLTAADLDDPDSDDIGDAIVEDPENKPKEEEKETPSEESSTEEKPAESQKVGDTEKTQTQDEPSTEGDKSKDQKKPDPKPVEGETPKERALRFELERKRKQIRELKGNKLFGDSKPVTPTVSLTAEDEEILKAYDPEQLAYLDKAVDVLAKKKGLVKQDEFIQQQTKKELQGAFEDWMDANPEFSEDKDPDGIMWKALENQYKELLTYKTPPKTSKELTKILNGIKKEIFGITTDTSDLKKVEAQTEKIKVSSHGAGTSTTPKTKSKEVDPEIDSLVKSGALKGFTDEDLEEMGLK